MASSARVVQKVAVEGREALRGQSVSWGTPALAAGAAAGGAYVLGRNVGGNPGPENMNLAQAMKDARSTLGSKVLMGVSLAIGFIPFVGVGASYAVDRYRNSGIEKRQKKVLAQYYREPIAARLGINPKRVNVSDLELAAQVDPMLANAVDKVTKERKYNNRAATFASVGVAAVGMVPFVGGMTNVVAKGAVHLGGAMAGSTISSLMEKDVLYTQDAIEIIETKRNEGQPVTAMDIVLMRIAQSPEWQIEFKKQNGKAFHKLSEAEQQTAIANTPEMILGADGQANALNRGLISPQNLLMAGPQSTSNFTGAEAQRRELSSSMSVNGNGQLQDSGSFAATELARRQAAIGKAQAL